MLTKNLFEEWEDCDLFMLKFYMLDHIMEQMSWIGSLSLLDASPFEHFDYVIKNCRKMTSMRRGSTLEENVKTMESSVAIEE